MVVPFVEVSHLPSSASFFATVLQPLGLEYIDAARNDPPSSVTFGASGDPILQIRQRLPPRLSSLVLTAPSRLAVLRFHDCGLSSNPPLLPGSQSQGEREPRAGGGEEAVTRAAILDLDGNRMEVVFPDPKRPQNAAQYNVSRVRRTQSSTDEVGRILEWNYDVFPAALRDARNITSTCARPSSAVVLSPSPDPNLSRVKPACDRARDPRQAPMSASPRQSASSSSSSSSNSGGINASTVVSALLGVAAGAALTYGIVSRDKGRAPRHDIDLQDPGTLPRRATFPERPPPETSRSRSQGDLHDKKIARPDKIPSRIAFSYADQDGSHKHIRWHEPEDQLPQRYLTQSAHRSIAGKSIASKSAPGSTTRSRVVDDSCDARSRHSTQAASLRSRSEAPLQRAPLSVAALETPSQARSFRYSRALSTGSRSIEPAYKSQPSTFVSAQTHRTLIAVDPFGLLPEHEVQYRTLVSGSSKAPAARAHGSKAPSCLSAREFPLPASEAPSLVSARLAAMPASQATSYVMALDMPLPESGIGSSHGNWDDDLDSIVPADSISCVGSPAGSGRRRGTHRY